MTDPVEFVSAMAGLDTKDALRERAAAIHAAGRGSLRTYADGKNTALKELKPDDFWKGLNAGWWTGGPEKCGPAPKLREAAWPDEDTGALWPFRLVTEQPGAGTLVAPLMAKLSQESRLRLAPHSAAMHPRDRFADGARLILETPYGRCPIVVALDESVAPGVVLVAGRPEIADIRSADGRARVVRI